MVRVAKILKRQAPRHGRRLEKEQKKHFESPSKSEWIRIGIPGFDDLLEKGVPKGVSVLVAGGPGTGKTIFCLQTLYNAARDGQDCLYITFEETPSRLVRHMTEFGWNVKVEGKAKFWQIRVEGAGKRGSMVIRRLDPFQIVHSVEELVKKAARRFSIDMVGMSELISAAFTPYMIAVDSLSALESAFTGKPEAYRITIEQLFRLFEEVGATTFLISETEEAPVRYSRMGIEEFLADGVFVFYNFKVGGQRTRGVEVLKLRGAKHEQKIVPLQITPHGMVVLPRETVYTVQ